MKPIQSIKAFGDSMTAWERKEILGFKEVYFLGNGADKVKGSSENEHNNGFDDENGDYNVVIGDHISYRFEV